jgi:hypothetical protein
MQTIQDCQTEEATVPSPLDLSPFVVPGTHVLVDDVGGSGGTPVNATTMAWGRDDLAAYTYDHIANLSGKNQHPTANIFEIGGGGTVGETTPYANVLNAVYSQASIDAMFRLLFRYIIGGTTNANSLTQMITTLLGRSDVANLNLLSLGTLIGTATPNDTVNTVVKRGATDSEVNLRAIISSIPNANGQAANILFNRVASQSKPFLLFRDELGALLAQWGPDGSVQGTRGVFKGLNGAGATLVVAAPVTPTSDILTVTDSALAIGYFRIRSDFSPVSRNGYWTGVLGSEKNVIDASGNFVSSLLSPRQFNEFAVTLSPSTLNAAIAAGKYVDAGGNAVNFAGGNATVTSDGTRYVWWAITLGSSGAIHATANSAGGSTVSGSATKAAFLASEKKIGYVLVPPGVGNLATATFDDWRGTDGPDGNTGSGGAGATATYITDAVEAGLSASKQLAAIASGAATVTGPPGNTGAAILAAQLRSGDRGGGDFDANLASRLQNDNSPGFEGQIGSSTNSMSITCGVNFPSWISITGRWRFITATATATTSGGAGTRYLIADLSGTGPGYTIALSTSNAVGSFQKVIADQYFDGTNFVGALNTSYVKKLGAAQYTPTDYQSATNPTALGASLVAGITGGPSISIPTTIAAKAWISFVVSHSGSAIGRTQFQLINNVNGTGFAAIFPYSEVEYLTSGQVNRGTATLSRYVILTPGTNVYQIGGVAASGTGVTPNAAYLYALVYGA